MCLSLDLQASEIRSRYDQIWCKQGCEKYKRMWIIFFDCVYRMTFKHQKFVQGMTKYGVNKVVKI